MPDPKLMDTAEAIRNFALGAGYQVTELPGYQVTKSYKQLPSYQNLSSY